MSEVTLSSTSLNGTVIRWRVRQHYDGAQIQMRIKAKGAMEEKLTLKIFYCDSETDRVDKGSLRGDAFAKVRRVYWLKRPSFHRGKRNKNFFRISLFVCACECHISFFTGTHPISYIYVKCNPIFASSFVKWENNGTNWRWAGELKVWTNQGIAARRLRRRQRRASAQLNVVCFTRCDRNKQTYTNRRSNHNGEPTCPVTYLRSLSRQRSHERCRVEGR